MSTKHPALNAKKGAVPTRHHSPAKPHMALRLLSSIALSSIWVNAGLYYMGKIFPVNRFLARDTVVFSPSRRFHIAVMVFSFGHEGVVLGAEFTWTLVDFYIDNGSVAPNMESAPEWCRLLDDCFGGKVDLIITQKISNVTRKPQDLSFVSRLLAAQKKPVGIYFISEDIFTLASYYQQDLHETIFLPEGWKLLPDEEEILQLPGGDHVE